MGIKILAETGIFAAATKPLAKADEIASFTHIKCKNDTTSGKRSTKKHQFQSYNYIYFDSSFTTKSRFHFAKYSGHRIH